MIKMITTHYKVTWGDSLQSIADKFDIETDVLKYHNNVREIYVGMVLSIPYQSISYKEEGSISHTLEYYMRRHLTKKRYFKFM